LYKKTDLDSLLHYYYYPNSLLVI